jgi:hypothetical protein
MSSGTVELDILNPFKRYLLASDCYSNRNDVASTNNCGKSLDSKFYQAKYYLNNPQGVKENDVPYQFVNSIVRLAASIRDVDAPSTKGNILSAIPGILKTSFKTYLYSELKKLLFTEDERMPTGAPRKDSDYYVKYDKSVDHTPLIKSITKFVDEVVNKGSRMVHAGLVMDSTLPGYSDIETLILENFALVDRERQKNKDNILYLLLKKIEEFYESHLRSNFATNYTLAAPTISAKSSLSSSSLTGALKARNIIDAYTNKNGKKLSNTDKELFELFFTIQIEDDGTGGKVERINLKTLAGVDYNFSKLKRKNNVDLTGGDLKLKLHVLSLALPLLSSGTKLWFMSNNKLTSLTVGNNNTTQTVLQDIFERAYLHGTVAVNGLPVDDCCNFADLYDQMNQNKLISDILCESKINLNRDLTREDKYQERQQIELDAQMSTNEWKKESEGVYSKKVKLNDNFETVIYETKNCDKYLEEINLEHNNNCGTTFVNTNDADKCKRYIQAITNAAGTNIQELKDYLNNDDFDWDGDIAKLSLIYPETAFKTLRAFGFKPISQYDIFADQYLIKVCGVELWIEKYVSEKIDDPKIVSKINANDKLKNYLACLVHFVNANPTLLNPGFTLASQEKVNVSDRTTELKSRGVIPYKDNDHNVGDVWSWEKLWENNNNVGEHPMKLEFYDDILYTHGGFPADIMFNSFRGLGHGQIGGNVSTFVDNIQLGGDYTSNITSEMKILLNDLKNSNKSFDTQSMLQIRSKLANFEKLEKELYEISKTIQIYTKLLRIAGNNNNEQVNLNVLKGYVDRHNGLLSKHQSTSNKFINLVKYLKNELDNVVNHQTSL